MPAATLADSLLLVVAVWALVAAALRLAAALTPDALARVVAAAVFAAAAAVVEALALGLAGLGSSPATLTGLAVLTGLVIRRAVPAPARSLPAQLAESLTVTRAPVLIGLGAVAGMFVAIAAIELHRPVLGQDAVTYHLPEVIGFVQSGHPGRVLNEFYGLPVGNYPITEEVLLAWATGITHGFSALILITLATAPLLLCAGWLGLAALGVNRAVAVLALAALILVPLVLEAWTQPGTDLEAFTWLVCCGALCLAAQRDPGLLAPALVAGGMGIGTKTTVITWVLVILAVTAFLQRARLRSQWRPLGAAAAVTVVCGLTWYLRNWIQHGSPLWPFSSFPDGDPRPEIIDYLSTSLLQSLHRTLLDHLNAYSAAVSGGVVLALGGMLTVGPGLLLRRRRLMIAGAVVALGTLEYAAGPVTGLPPGGTELVGVIGSTLRYLMPAFGAGAVALALTASDRNRAVAGVGLLGLVGTLVWDVTSDAPVRFYLPSNGWLWPGIAIGAIALPASGWALRAAAARTHRPLRSGLAVAASLTAAILAALVLAAGSTHFSYRSAATKDFAAPVTAFMQGEPAYAGTRASVATSGTGLAPLAGDRLQHRLSVIPVNASCQSVGAYLRRGWVVTEVVQAATRTGVLAHVIVDGTAAGCLAKVTPVFDNGQYAVYAPDAHLRISPSLS